MVMGSGSLQETTGFEKWILCFYILLNNNYKKKKKKKKKKVIRVFKIYKYTEIDDHWYENK